MNKLTKKIGFGRFGAPVWAMALAVAGITAVAGQALGPVLAGSAGGNVGVVASQNLFFADVTATKGHNGDIDQAAANIDTAGMILQGAFRMHRGDDASTLDVEIENRGDSKKSATLTVTRPAGSSVDLSNDSSCGLAQSSVAVGNGAEVDTYLLTVEGEDTCTVTAEVTVGTAEPLGSYNVTIALNEIP